MEELLGEEEEEGYRMAFRECRVLPVFLGEAAAAVLYTRTYSMFGLALRANSLVGLNMSESELELPGYLGYSRCFLFLRGLTTISFSILIGLNSVIPLSSSSSSS
jgi:hypothetical protein